LSFAKKGASIAAKHDDIPGLFILSRVTYNVLQQDLVSLSRPQAAFPASQHIEHGSDRNQQHSP
ncbi:MAG: hypothetical protein O7G88_00475, partial [bacterium]|nr:hypothetical protein [bacterium]